jgi:hypothetical protein
VGVGKGTSHGLANLVLTTLDEETWDDEDASKCPVLKPIKTIKTMHFHGTTYK